MASLLGTWGMDSQEGFDEYMSHMGVGFFLRKMGNQLRPGIHFFRQWESGLINMNVVVVKENALCVQIERQWISTYSSNRLNTFQISS